MKKILVWRADNKLQENIKKINPKEYIIDYLNEALVEDLEFDYLLISQNNFRVVKKELKEKYNVPVDKLFTFEEFWVKDYEATIKKKYRDYWSLMQEKEIQLLKGKNVVIVGGSSGIGEETAIASLYHGANVVIIGRNEEKLKDIKRENDEYGEINYYKWDICLIQNIEKHINRIEEILSGKIDIWINCAGIWEGKDFFEVTEEDFDSIITTNLKAPYFLCQKVAEYYIKNYIKGHIVNVCSNVGLLPSVKPYGLSKSGLIAFTKGLGLHLAQYGIVVNGVAPGAVATPLAGWVEGAVPARRNAANGRLCFPCEVADIIVYLASFRGENMIGEIVGTDGGDRAISRNL